MSFTPHWLFYDHIILGVACVIFHFLAFECGHGCIDCTKPFPTNAADIVRLFFIISNGLYRYRFANKHEQTLWILVVLPSESTVSIVTANCGLVHTMNASTEMYESNCASVYHDIVLLMKLFIVDLQKLAL
eukprot:948028_1